MSKLFLAFVRVNPKISLAVCALIAFLAGEFPFGV